MKIETIQLWEDREDVELTTFLHMPDSFIPEPVKKPAMIVCPGGAYMSCPRHGNEGDPVAMAFAIDGYQAFVLEYSVAEKAPKGKTLFPAQLLDLGKAILTIREHAGEWGVDVDKISLIGFSAGAHLAGMYASCWQESLLSEYFHFDPCVFKPMAALLIYGLMDYSLQEEFLKRKGQVPMLPDDLNTYTFGCVHPDKEELLKYSPITHVTEQMPPVFLAAAVDDGMVPAMHSIRMAEKLQSMELAYELHMFRYGDHGFSLGRNLFEPFKKEKTHACTAWVELAKTFLMHIISPETTAPEENPFKLLEERGA